MTQRIVRWDTDAVIWEGGAASVKDALHQALASGANLSWANLSWASLSGASLSWASLSRASLTRADLSGAKGIDAVRTTPLLMLLDQPSPIRAYKLVTADGVGPFNGGITYVIGESYVVGDANDDPMTACGAGINVATLDWCLREWQPGYRILLVEFTAADIACIPTATDGKFRLHRCVVVGEKDVRQYGLGEQQAGSEADVPSPTVTHD